MNARPSPYWVKSFRPAAARSGSATANSPQLTMRLGPGRVAHRWRGGRDVGRNRLGNGQRLRRGVVCPAHEQVFLEPPVGRADQAEQSVDLGRRPADEAERLLDLDDVLADVRRPAQQPEADIDGDARPTGAYGQVVAIERAESAGRKVEDVVQPAADLGNGPDGFAVLCGQV